jgi:S-formylglutathione hydrolase FrmB
MEEKKMAFLQMSIFSQILGMKTNINIILPDYKDIAQIPFEGYPVLYLLHGYTGDYSDWIRSSNIERYADEMQVAVIMPNAAKSFYTDMYTGDNYWKYISYELPALMEHYFPISKAYDKTFVMGLSMGGYGALKWALAKPDKFCFVASFSGVVDIVSFRKNLEKDQSLIPSSPVPPDFSTVFSPEYDLKGSTNDLIHLIQNIDKDSCPIIKLYCGDKDFLLNDNILFQELALKRKLVCSLEIFDGNHEWVFWDRALQKAMKSLPIKKSFKNA